MLKSKLKKLALFRKRRSGGSDMGNCAGSGQGSQGKGGGKEAAPSGFAAAGERRKSSPSTGDGGELEASKSTHGKLVLK